MACESSGPFMDGHALRSPPPPPPLKRRFWQIHLSTALVLMLLASGIVYVNVRSQIDHSAGTFAGRSMAEVGWPYSAVGWGQFIDGIKPADRASKIFAFCTFFGGIFVNWKYVGLDVLLTGTPFVFCGVVCEYLVRRRHQHPR